MKRKRIKAKELQKELQAQGFNESLIHVSKKDAVEICEDKQQAIKLISINGFTSFFYHKIKTPEDQNKEILIPTLKLLQKQVNLLKHITIDMGAIKFVVNGADIMRPGITKIQEDIQKNEAIAIVDETHGKAIAVGIAVLPSKEMQIQEKGKSIKNIHFVGDAIWNVN